MPSVELKINGRSYSVACDAGEENRVLQLGGMIDDRARQMGAAPSDAQRFLMVGLLLADELDEAKAKLASFKSDGPVESGSDSDLLVAAVDHLAERIDHIAATLAKA